MARPVPADAFAKTPALRHLADRLSRRLPEDIQGMQSDLASSYFFYEVKIPAAVPVRELLLNACGGPRPIAVPPNSQA
jgi:hypothetical protein